jgi:HAE1 family hydrophobic/amphiphilic exporter-1
LPPRCSEGQKKKKIRPDSWFKKLMDTSEAFLDKLNDSYKRLLEWALSNRRKTLGVAAGVLFSSLLLFPLIGTELLPPSDEGEVSITGEMEIGLRLEIADEQARRVEEIVYNSIPEMQSAMVSVGGGGRAGGATQLSIRISLVPLSERSRSNVEVADELRRKLADQIPGMDIRVNAPQGQF